LLLLKIDKIVQAFYCLWQEMGVELVSLDPSTRYARSG